MHIAGMPRDPTARRESRHVPRRMQRPSLDWVQAWVQATAPTCGLESCQSASTCLASVAVSSMTAWVAVLLHSSIVVHGLGGTPQQRCQRTRSALVRRGAPLPWSNAVSPQDGSPIHIGSHAWRGGKRLGYTAFEPCRGLVEGVIESLRGQRSLRLCDRRTEKLRTKKLGYDTFLSVGRVFRH